ncbi:sirQ protein [Aspergillus bombycis]|uniref:SirQ protein n=1 Tax=Aspergillus bombycis TaxID=109264 RepID=A0A1F7ZSA1_9EURO|nr:sirQ protein [Aspergillus bombycis]OGM42326.1 sirQ protein [Aspergillus bombycis]
MSQNGKYALVFGASGISGWSLLNQCLSYPTSSSFRRVVGLCNRPLKTEDAYLPVDSRLDIVSGIDLTQSVSSVTDQLKARVHNVESVEVVFYCAYIEAGDFQARRKVNAALLRTAIEAISGIAANLEAVILQTGGKGYGLEFSNELEIPHPLRESMPRIPEPWRSSVFYYDQYDILSELSKSQNWSFSEIRPDGIVGFVPGTNVMNIAQGIALYLTLYREVYGQGAEVPFPGSLHGYRSTHSDTFQDILSKMEIYTALNRDKCPNGSAFNIADGDVVSWEQVWPGLCSYFGLVGVQPQEHQKKIEEFVRENQGAWDGLVETHGLRGGLLEAQNWPFIQFMLVDFDFDREYSLDAARAIGFTERIDTVEGYQVAFDRMAAARIIPAFH